ncbi:cytochrome b5 domain-containing protein [Risungbinella massiliensis]|uniref:cytochrome b5 domain-containing protein n=1 Tax=Risungbinella massiliensis TaxID=1329796 RepID=UPI0005CC1F1E|nr:cytochrome b5 domain-containing protein [Risungbinella massiliensis]
MQNIEMVRLQLNHLVTQAHHDIYTLSTLHNRHVQQQILQRLWDTVSSIQFLGTLLADQATARNQKTPPVLPFPQPPSPPTNQRTFTIQELSNYNGKNGMPAYVAVNGIVYNVTNNRTWAAATHFGLIAGKDYTREFASCHTGQQAILSTLPIVGRLV